MLSLQTLTTIETLLMSRSHPLWGEFMPLAQVIGEVQDAKKALTQSRVQLASPSSTAISVAGSGSNLCTAQQAAGG